MTRSNVTLFDDDDIRRLAVARANSDTNRTNTRADSNASGHLPADGRLMIGIWRVVRLQDGGGGGCGRRRVAELVLRPLQLLVGDRRVLIKMLAHVAAAATQR